VTLPAIPTALDSLRRQLVTTSTVADLSMPLRALQLRGLSQRDLAVYVERLRAVNDVTDKEELIEENCVLALEMIEGDLPRIGLRWDASTELASLLPRVLDDERIAAALPFALEPSDLLPPRSNPRDADDATWRYASEATAQWVESLEYLASPAAMFRAPKDAFTSRPAALLAIPDRVVLEALATYTEAALDAALPKQVIWPRKRLERPSSPTDRATIRAWKSRYVVKADVANFYERIEHSLLGVVLSTKLNIPFAAARATSALLTVTMSSDRGLPQGPLASDILASAYMLLVDQRLDETHSRFVRYADDYFLPAETMGEGRLLLQQLEASLRDIGLSLNPTKTQIMRRETFNRALERPSPALEALKEAVAETQTQALEELDDADAVSEALKEVGVSEETLWDLLYHRTTTLDAVVVELLEEAGPAFGAAYSLYFKTVAELLKDESQQNFASLEAVARESLALLTPTSVWLDPRDVGEVQTWFPQLTPQIVGFLTSRRGRARKSAQTYIRSRLEEPSRVDWVDAWMCHAAGETRASAVRALRALTEDPDTGELTRAEALRALLKLGKLRKAEWEEFVLGASTAMRSEMFFAALGDAKAHAHVAEALGRATDPVLRHVAGKLLTLTTPT
jgi:Reverse transcriptase (RNA-dependent DNA polymerase)